MNVHRLLWVLAAAILLTGCLPGPNDLVGVAPADGELAGFWLGLWHGLVVCLSFLISLFTRDVQLYEVHNNGGWYNLGFFLGLLMSLGGSSGGGVHRWRKRR